MRCRGRGADYPEDLLLILALRSVEVGARDLVALLVFGRVSRGSMAFNETQDDDFGWRNVFGAARARHDIHGEEPTVAERVHLAMAPWVIYQDVVAQSVIEANRDAYLLSSRAEPSVQTVSEPRQTMKILIELWGHIFIRQCCCDINQVGGLSADERLIGWWMESSKPGSGARLENKRLQ